MTGRFKSPLRRRAPGVLRTAGILTAAALLAVAAPPSSAQPAPPAAGAEIAARLTQAARAAESFAPDPSPARMSTVRELAGLPATVVSGGRRVEVGADPLLAALTGQSPTEFVAAARRLDTLASEARRGAAPAPAPGEVAAALSRAYRGIRQEPSAMDRLREIAARVVGRLLDWLTSALPGRSSRWLPWAILGALVAGFLVILLRTRLVPDRSARAGPDGAAATDWRAVAEEALARGDFRAAVRAHYRLLLAALAGKGLIEDVPSLTPAECRRALRDVSPALSPAVARATGAFERAFYAELPPTVEDVESVRSAEREVRAA